jgi:hypothetical protein
VDSVKHPLLCVGPRQDPEGDPGLFHEQLCRNSFLRNPVSDGGAGIEAQRALLRGGTLLNGKVQVVSHWSHGQELRDLIAGVKFLPLEDVTCYGGQLGLAPPKNDGHTHMRHVPLSDYVLDGIEFSRTFPVATTHGVGNKYGFMVPLQPQCVNPVWSDMIASSGIGYMANTHTICPLERRSRNNVTIHAVPLGRNIPDVMYSSVVVLRACSKGIAKGARILSPYEPWKLQEKWKYRCMSAAHYNAAGHSMPITDDTDQTDELV